MKHLPLFTAFVLVALIGLWNVTAFDHPVDGLTHAAAPSERSAGAGAGAAAVVLEGPTGPAPVTEAGLRREPSESAVEPLRTSIDAGEDGDDIHRAPGHGPLDAEVDEDGRLAATGPRVDGLRSGWWRLLWSSGELKGEGEYLAGRRVGEWAFWHEGGTLRAVGEYVDGDRDGPWREWFEDGSESLRAGYTDGELDGLWELRYSNGQIREKGRYERGLRQGPWEFFDFAGRSDVRTGDYVRGRRVD